MPTPDLSLIVYCRDDPVSARWVGIDNLLTELQCDQNIYTLTTATQWLLDNYAATVSLASVTQPTASTLLFTFTDATTQGPFDLPVATFSDRGDWAIDTPYLINDTFNAPDGGLYRVTFDHTSSHTSFDPAANDGMGHDYYAPMIPPRGNTIPAGGIAGWYYRKNSSTDYDANWAPIRATEVVFGPSTDSALTAINVSDAIEQVEGLIPTSFDSTVITYTPASWLTATNVSDALGQLADINALHVVYTPSTDSALISNNVAAALEELEALIAAGGGTAASTTEALSGTNTTKFVTPDSLAALWEKGSDVASATTIAFGEGGFFHITGTTTITDIDWTIAKDGRAAFVVFDGILTLTHNGTTLKLPGAANITTAAGDRAIFVQDASDNVICIGYFRASGQPLVPSTTGVPVSITVAASDESTALTTGTAKVTFRMPHAMTVTAVRASLSTAQSTGSVLTVDVNEAGSTILSTKLTFDNTEKTTTTAATPPVISDSSLADDAEITIDIDQVGDGTATGLKVTLIGTR